MSLFGMSVFLWGGKRFYIIWNVWMNQSFPPRVTRLVCATGANRSSSNARCVMHLSVPGTSMGQSKSYDRSLNSHFLGPMPMPTLGVKKIQISIYRPMIAQMRSITTLVTEICNVMEAGYCSKWHQCTEKINTGNLVITKNPKHLYNILLISAHIKLHIRRYQYVSDISLIEQYIGKAF